MLMGRFKEILSIKEGFTHTGEPRTLEEEVHNPFFGNLLIFRKHIKILNKVKMECLLMVDRYMDIVIGDRFHKFLMEWKYTEPNLDRLLIHERAYVHQPNGCLQFSTKEAMAEKLMEDFKKSGATIATRTCDMKASPPLGRCTDGFIPVLLELLVSNNRELNSMACFYCL